MYAYTCCTHFACIGATRRKRSAGRTYSVYLLHCRHMYACTCTQFACVGATARPYSVYLHYWYKSTNIDATRRERSIGAQLRGRMCTQFTCITGTKVQILTLMPAARCAGEGQVGGADAGGGFYCSVYLLYWYKKITKTNSANTDTCSLRRRRRSSWRRGCGTK
jgi:hypothetical protein